MSKIVVVVVDSNSEHQNENLFTIQIIWWIRFRVVYISIEKKKQKQQQKLISKLKRTYVKHSKKKRRNHRTFDGVTMCMHAGKR